MSDAAITLTLVAGFSLVPLLMVVLSSFAKIAIVLTILRNALGAPGVPPTLVITGFALLLTAFIVAPVAHQAAREARPAFEQALSQSADQAPASARVRAYISALTAAGEPIRTFLERHARDQDRRAFSALTHSIRGSEPDDDPPEFLVLACAFVTSELRAAFMIGVVVLIPFVIVDLVVASVLVSLGLSAVPIASIAMPLKLILFVAVDGWQLLSAGLISGYT